MMVATWVTKKEEGGEQERGCSRQRGSSLPVKRRPLQQRYDGDPSPSSDCRWHRAELVWATHSRGYSEGINSDSKAEPTEARNIAPMQ